MRRTAKEILVREVVILSIFIATGYILEVLFNIFNRDYAGVPIPFWKDPYFYQFWKNSVRENAQIIRYLGYPLCLAIRFIIWAIQLVIAKIKIEIKEEKKERSMKYDEETVKKVLEEIIREIQFNKKIEDVMYNYEFSWYVVRFNFPPSTMIPRKYIDDYIDSEGRSCRKEIIHSLLT